jgi:hypothetical protein
MNTPNIIPRGTYGQTNKQTHGQIFTQYLRISSHSIGAHIFSCLNHIFRLIPFYSCVSLITISPAMPSTTLNTSSQMPFTNSWHLNNTTKQHLPWPINRQAMSPLCYPPATSHLPSIAACCLPLATQC